MQDKKDLKYFIYARKSSESEDRQMNSIEDQLNILLEKSKEDDLNIVEVLKESGSAKKPGRKVFNEMMERIHKGEANGILCWKLNRLSRNSLEGGMIAHSLETGILKEILTPGKSYYPEDNVMMMAVELGMATQYSKDLAKDTKRGLLEKAKRGWYPAPAPIGYMKHPDMKKGEKEIMIDTKSFDKVKKVWDLVLSGEYNPSQALKFVVDRYDLKNKKGKKIAVSSIYHIFKNPFYYGEFEYPRGSGNWYKGKHKAMITKEEFNKVQSLISPHSKTNTETSLKDLFPYKGPLSCGECSSSITAERKRRITCDCKNRFSALKSGICPKCKTSLSGMINPKIEERIYYHCTKKKNKLCTQHSYKPLEIENSIKEIFKLLTIPEGFLKIGLDYIKKLDEKDRILDKNSKQDIKKSIKKIKKDLDKILELRMDGTIDSNTYTTKVSGLKKDKHKLKKALSNLDNNSIPEKAKYYFNFAKNSIENFENSPDSKKKSMFYSLSSNQFITDGKLELARDTTLSYFLDVSKACRDKDGKVRTSKNSYSTMKKEPIKTLDSVLLHR